MPLPKHYETVRTIQPEASLRDAAKAMIDHQVGALLIRKDGDAPVTGILTDRDIVREIARGHNPEQATVESYTGIPLAMVSATASRRDITRKMRVHGVRRVPLTDEEGNVTGLISLDDLVFDMGEELADLSKAIKVELAHEDPEPDPDR